MAIEIVKGEYGMVLTINISGIELSDFTSTQTQTILYIEVPNGTPNQVTTEFAIDATSNNVSWEVPKSATVGSSAPLINEGSYRCQLEFVNTIRGTEPTKISKTEVFDIVVKRGL